MTLFAAFVVKREMRFWIHSRDALAIHAVRSNGFSLVPPGWPETFSFRQLEFDFGNSLQVVSAGFAVWAHDDATSNGGELIKGEFGVGHCFA